ncbi:MAG: delta-60 repeat domain-containing protein [Sandaracinaceae bacterium]
MRALLVLALVLVPTAASAQPFFRAPIGGQGSSLVSASHHDTIADATADGGSVLAVHFDSDVAIGGQWVRSLGAGRTVALVRVDRAGRVLWIRRFAEEAGTGQPHLRSVSRIDALPDGGAVIGGTFGFGGDDQGALMRVDAAGRTRWLLRPSVTTDYSRFVSALTPSGSMIVLGDFFRGRFQLPGAEAWSSQQRFTSFLAEVDLGTGQVRWARRILGEGRALEVAPDGTILVAGQFQRQLRVGRSTLRGVGGERDVFVARYAADGTPRDAIAFGTETEDHPRGIAVQPGGGFAVLIASDHPGGTESHTLLGYDAEIRPAFQQPLGPRAFLARSRGAGPILVALPGPARQVSIRGRPYEVVDHMELVRVSAQGARISRRPIQFPGVGLLMRSLHARFEGGRVSLSGAMTAGRTSESFQVWLDAPAAPRTVVATVGSVL